ncbi:MAG: sulfurtransferase [Kiloniellaceae bacterium]
MQALFLNSWHRASRRIAAAAAFGALVVAAAATASLTAATPLAAAPAVQPLVNVDWLLANAEREEVVILDIRNQLDGGSEKTYLAGHIPGAVYSDYLKAGWRTERDGVPGQLPAIETLEALIGELGISNDSHVVIVSAGTGALDAGSAARVYWTFKVVGHDQVSILDGGYRAYTADPANPLETGRVEPLPDIFSAEFRPELLADRAAVQAALQDGDLVVDTRPSEFFEGRKRHTWAKRAGTIPGAVSLPDEKFVDAEGRFVKAEGVGALLQSVGFTGGEDQETIMFCNTGHWAALGWFAQSELLGNKNARVYDGSMVDWSGQDALPVERREAVATN